MIGLTLFLILCYVVTAHAEEKNPESQTIKLKLQEAVLVALSKNIDVKIERLQPQIAETDIEAEESVFDPTVKADIAEASTKRQTDLAIFLTGAIEPSRISTEIDTRLEKKFSPGTTAELSFENNRLSSNSFVQRFNPSWSSELVLSVTQPLLKDFGREFNLGRIIIAKNNKSISDYHCQEQQKHLRFSV
jgi:hypothetical protein